MSFFSFPRSSVGMQTRAIKNTTSPEIKRGQKRYAVKGQIADFSILFEVKEICAHKPGRPEL